MKTKNKKTSDYAGRDTSELPSPLLSRLLCDTPRQDAEAGLSDKEQAALEVLPASLRSRLLCDTPRQDAETGRSNRERAALEVLRSTGIDVLEAALVAKYPDVYKECEAAAEEEIEKSGEKE